MHCDTILSTLARLFIVIKKKVLLATFSTLVAPLVKEYHLLCFVRHLLLNS